MYFPHNHYPGLLINLLTLLGSIFGQLLFGFLADYYGRTRLYGIELVLVIVSTIGVATSSFGYNDMNFIGLFIFVCPRLCRGLDSPSLLVVWLLILMFPV